MSSTLKDLRSEFRSLYNRDPRFFCAPGRVNLIGEHTDYNDGFVLPMAIEYYTTVAVACREDRKLRLRSVELDETEEINLDDTEIKMRGVWLDYIEGVARILERQNVKLRGADILITSDVPTGAGLSSSAALEISIGLALTEMSATPIERVRLALTGQAAEQEFVGANVGIMDQYISALAQKEHALLIDCRSLHAEHISFKAPELAIVICDSKVKHELSSSEYNTRRSECEQGVELLRKDLPGIKALRDVQVEDFERFQFNLPEVIRKRCRHVITENQRTLDAAEALKNGDMVEFGRLMWLSHESLKNDYEVSCRELDALVNIAAKCSGVLGARMTGGGFGGSTVNLVPRTNLAEFQERVASEYFDEFNFETKIYVSGAAHGAMELYINN